MRNNTQEDLHLAKKQKYIVTTLIETPTDDQDLLSGSIMVNLLPPSPQDSPTNPELPLSYILSLPTEILQDIISLVADVSHNDALCFSSTCKNIRAVVSWSNFYKLSLISN